jgi:hypothetical protein
MVEDDGQDYTTTQTAEVMFANWTSSTPPWEGRVGNMAVC